MKVLHVTGGDYSAMNVEDQIGIDKAIQMTHKNGGELVINNNGVYAELKILNFGDVDAEFIRFIKNEFIEYPKDSNFYIIGEGEVDE